MGHLHGRELNQLNHSKLVIIADTTTHRWLATRRVSSFGSWHKRQEPGSLIVASSESFEN
jgi:hypothetical protein